MRIRIHAVCARAPASAGGDAARLDGGAGDSCLRRELQVGGYVDMHSPMRSCAYPNTRARVAQRALGPPLPRAVFERLVRALARGGVGAAAGAPPPPPRVVVAAALGSEGGGGCDGDASSGDDAGGGAAAAAGDGGAARRAVRQARQVELILP